MDAHENFAPPTQVEKISGVAGKLYFGDNLDILRSGDLGDESIDLVYLDPPFNSDRSYNVLFHERDLEPSHAQIRAFEDTWHWDQKTQSTFEDITGPQAPKLGIPDSISILIESLSRALPKRNDLLAYLVMMVPRLVELRRVLKNTGSLYLHCDPTASHYLKVILDAIFGPTNFRNEIVWRRAGAHSPKKGYGPVHDCLLFYSKDPDLYFFNHVKRPYMKGHVSSRYSRDPSGDLKFTSGGNVLTGSGKRGGESGAKWKGFDPTAKDRHWAIPGFLAKQMPDGFQKLGVLAKLDALLAAGLVEISKGSVWPQPVRFLSDEDGNPITDIWAYQPYTDGTVHGTEGGIDADVQWLGPTSPERVGYETQKPVGLLERVITASCPPDGTVLDPFCGCGTTIMAAERLRRDWIGIDLTHLAIQVIRGRMANRFPGIEYELLGEPQDLGSARTLAESDPFQFQWWAVHRLGAYPSEGEAGARQGKKGRDRGVDGVLKYRAEDDVGKVVLSVKGGRLLTPAMVRELSGTRQAEHATIGVLVTLYEASREMRDAAIKAGLLRLGDKEYPRIQLISVKDIFDGKRIQHPGDPASTLINTTATGSLYLPGFEKPLPARKGVRIRTATHAPVSAPSRVAVKAPIVEATKRKGPRSAGLPDLLVGRRPRASRRP
jgi:site-specific DNA-methyltransferase (adenine-specific)